MTEAGLSPSSLWPQNQSVFQEIAKNVMQENWVVWVSTWAGLFTTTRFSSQENWLSLNGLKGTKLTWLWHDTNHITVFQIQIIMATTNLDLILNHVFCFLSNGDVLCTPLRAHQMKPQIRRNKSWDYSLQKNQLMWKALGFIFFEAVYMLSISPLQAHHCVKVPKAQHIINSEKGKKTFLKFFDSAP